MHREGCETARADVRQDELERENVNVNGRAMEAGKAVEALDKGRIDTLRSGILFSVEEKDRTVELK